MSLQYSFPWETTVATPGAAPSSTPAREIVVSNLPLDVNEAQVKELFHTTVGRLREVKVHFDIAGRSTGVATIVFCKNGDGNCAFAQYNNRAIDNSNAFCGQSPPRRLARDDLLGSPMRANEAPLTLDDLTPRPRAIPAVSSPRAHTANKSLLPTSKFNLHRPTTLRAPKPAPTAHNRPKPKPASGVPSKVKEVSGVPKEPAVREPNSVPPTAVAPPASIALSKPVVHARTKSTVISSEKNTPAGEQRLNTTEVVSEMAPHSPPKPNLHVDEPAPSPPSSAPVDNAVAAEQTAHPVRNIAPAATVPAAKPESKSRETIAVAKTKAVPNPRPIVRAQSYPDSADGGPAVGAMDMGIAARLVMYREQLTAMGSFPASDNDDAMGTGTDPAVRDAAVQDDASGGEIPRAWDDNGDDLRESDTELDTVEDTDYFEAWEAQPKPRTYDEREERRLEKREKAATKHHAAEMRKEESSSDELGDEEEEPVPEQVEEQAREEYGDEVVDSIILADDVADWVDTVHDDAAPQDPKELGALAAASLKQHAGRRTIGARAALRVAKYHGRGPAFQRVIAAQARFFEANGALKPSHQGQREKSNGLLDDEGFYLGQSKLLQHHINETLLPSLALKKKTVSIRHCQRWLWRLGYRRKRHQKGVYWDGHERKDVKRRRKEFLAELHAYEHLRATYAEPDMQEVLKKKGRGRLIMVSAFLCERYGLLALTPEMMAENEKMAAELRLAITDSTTVIYPDNKASGDDYWNMKQMIEQLIIAILIARRMFPKAIIHWIFDNSSAHGSLAPDALTTTKMNVNPGGKVPEMRDTIIPDSNPHGHAGEAQKMTFDKICPTNHPYKEFEGLPKGMKVILAERGYTKDTNEEEDEEHPVDCCMRRLLSLQPDFAGQKSQLELLIAATSGMVCHFLPKFHPEMNPIEYFWAWVKRWFRERSNGTWQKAKDLVDEGLQLCPLPTIRRFYRRAHRYGSVYRLGATGPIAEFAVKKYRSHRGVRATELVDATVEWKARAEAMSRGVVLVKGKGKQKAKYVH
ncbi:hypothetical protein B0H14DRAFT_3888832 [Mycena olivaceomarginata]|nr:hypothetical protein B0H14DRAFT_3888832 [Mycena olivaceomarginata]